MFLLTFILTFGRSVAKINYLEISSQIIFQPSFVKLGRFRSIKDLTVWCVLGSCQPENYDTGLGMSAQQGWLKSYFSWSSHLSFSLHTHSCKLSITEVEFVKTTYIIASWLNIAKPLWLRLNCSYCASLHRGGSSPSHPCGGAVELCLLQVSDALVDSALHLKFKLNIEHWGKWEEWNGKMTKMKRRREGEKTIIFIQFLSFFLCKNWHKTLAGEIIAQKWFVSVMDGCFGTFLSRLRTRCDVIKWLKCQRCRVKGLMLWPWAMQPVSLSWSCPAASQLRPHRASLPGDKAVSVPPKSPLGHATWLVGSSMESFSFCEFSSLSINKLARDNRRTHSKTHGKSDFVIV